MCDSLNISVFVYDDELDNSITIFGYEIKIKSFRKQQNKM